MSFRTPSGSSTPPRPAASAKVLPARKLAFNVDAVAIAIALTLAALIRLNLLPRIGW